MCHSFGSPAPLWWVSRLWFTLRSCRSLFPVKLRERGRKREREREMDFQRHAHRVRDEIITKEPQRDNVLWPSMTRRGTITTHHNLVFFMSISVIPSWILYSFLLYFPFSIVSSNMNVCLYRFNGCNAGSTSKAVEFISLHVALVNEVDSYCQS